MPAPASRPARRSRRDAARHRPGGPRAATTRRAAAVVAASAVVLAGCGGSGDDDPAGGGSGGDALALCKRYRSAVTGLRLTAPPATQAADYRTLAARTRAARSGTTAGDLTREGDTYLQLLDRLAPAYDDAAAASQRSDREGVSRALDVIEDTDDALNGVANAGGLADCALPASKPGETGVSQSGFPATVVPERAVGQVPPADDVVVYPLSATEAVTIARGPKLGSGTTPVTAAAAAYRRANETQRPRDAGAAGNRLVPMRRFELATDTTKATDYVFSGQGSIWQLRCITRDGATPTPALRTACDRAVAGLGFLMP